MKSQDCAVITQWSSAKIQTKITSGQEGKDGRRVGGQGGRKWRKEAVGGKQDAAFMLNLCLCSISDLSGDTIAGAGFLINQKKNKKSTSHSFGFGLIVPSSVLLCVGSEGAS